MYKKNVGAGPVSAQKGITLIALVITIIVMLILVGVTISMAVNGGLFDYAGKAVGDTKNAIKAEQAISNGGIEVDGVWYDSIDDYLKRKPAVTTIHSWTRSGDTFTCSHCNTTYTMGQTVPYTDAGAASATSTEAANGYSDQTIEAEDATWVVLGIQDTNNDGVNETLLITTQGPVSENSFYLYGAEAYNNGPSEINRICKELYSNSEYGEARGMTIEDVNAALNYTPLGGYYYNSGYKTTGNLTTKLSALPTWDNIKGNYKTPDGTNTVEAYGEYELNGYYYTVSGLNLTNPVDSTTSAITEVEKNTIFGTDTDYFYWLASRGVYAYSDFAGFGPGHVGYGDAYSCLDSFDSDGDEGNFVAGLRPVVSLTSKLPVSE